MNRREYLEKEADKRILLLDGAMGTLVQQKKLNSIDFTTKELNDKDIEYQGLGELLNINRPDIIFDIHNEFLNSGADIISTNTFCANRITLEEYDRVNSILAEVKDTPDTTGWRPFETAMTYDNVGKEIIVTNKKRKIDKCMILSGAYNSDIAEPILWIPKPKYPTN